MSVVQTTFSFGLTQMTIGEGRVAAWSGSTVSGTVSCCPIEPLLPAGIYNGALRYEAIWTGTDEVDTSVSGGLYLLHITSGSG